MSTAPPRRVRAPPCRAVAGQPRRAGPGPVGWSPSRSPAADSADMTLNGRSPAPRRGFALRPEGILMGAAAPVAIGAGTAKPLAGGPLAFALCEIVAGRERILLPVDEARRHAAARGQGEAFAAALDRLTAP